MTSSLGRQQMAGIYPASQDASLIAQCVRLSRRSSDTAPINLGSAAREPTQLGEKKLQLQVSLYITPRLFPQTPARSRDLAILYQHQTLWQWKPKEQFSQRCLKAAIHAAQTPSATSWVKEATLRDSHTRNKHNRHSECLGERATLCPHGDLLPALTEAGLWPLQGFLQGLRARSCAKADLAPPLWDSNTRKRADDATHALNLRQWPCKNLPRGRLH